MNNKDDTAGSDAFANELVGQGELNIDGANHMTYVGTFPHDITQKSKVAIMSKKTLDTIIGFGMDILLAKKAKMHESFYDATKANEVDNVVFVLPEVLRLENSIDKKIISLFLDRNFYSHDIKNYVMIRYLSMDQSLREEGGQIEGVE
jgi:hypothetical protein